MLWCRSTKEVPRCYRVSRYKREHERESVRVVNELPTRASPGIYVGTMLLSYYSRMHIPGPRLLTASLFIYVCLSVCIFDRFDVILTIKNILYLSRAISLFLIFLKHQQVGMTTSLLYTGPAINMLYITYFIGLIMYQRVSLWISSNMQTQKFFFEAHKERANFRFQKKLENMLMYKFVDYLGIFNDEIQ